jgi:hypothetical protein
MKKEIEGLLYEVESLPYTTIFYFDKPIKEVSLEDKKVNALFSSFIGKKVRITIEEIE